MSDEEEYLVFRPSEILVKNLYGTTNQVTLRMTATYNDQGLWNDIHERIVERGLRAYRGDTLLNELNATLKEQVDELTEDNERFKKGNVELAEEINRLSRELKEKDDELARLHKLEQELEGLAGLRVGPVVD